MLQAALNLDAAKLLPTPYLKVNTEFQKFLLAGYL